MDECKLIVIVMSGLRHRSLLVVGFHVLTHCLSVFCHFSTVGTGLFHAHVSFYMTPNFAFVKSFLTTKVTSP